jgi:hypothetical protein
VSEHLLDLIDSWKYRQGPEPPLSRTTQPPQPEKTPFHPPQPRPQANFGQRPPLTNPIDAQTLSQAGPNTSSIDNTFVKHMDRDRSYPDENEQKVQRIVEKKLH